MKIIFQCLMSIALVNRNSEVNINIMASVLLEAGTACPSRMPGFTPGWVFLRGGFVVGWFFFFFFFFLRVCVAHRFNFICRFVLFYFVFLFFIVFGLSLVYPILPVSLDYRFLIAPSLFSNVYC